MKTILGALVGAALAVAAMPATAQQVDHKLADALRTEIESVVVAARLARPDAEYRGISLDELAEVGLPGLRRSESGLPMSSVGYVDVHSTATYKLDLVDAQGIFWSLVDAESVRAFEVALTDVPAWACASIAAFPVGSDPEAVRIGDQVYKGREIKSRTVGRHCFDGRAPGDTIPRIGLVYR